MKVYVLTQCESQEGGEVVGVFKVKQSGEDYIKEHQLRLSIDYYELVAWEVE